MALLRTRAWQAALLSSALFGPAHAAPAPAFEEPRTLVVSGHADLSGVPDEASVTAGVVTEAKNATDAVAANTRAMNQVFAALKQSGIPDKDVRTANFNIMPQYSAYTPNAGNMRIIVGYQVSNQVSVRVETLGRLGDTLDAMVSAGANQINSIAFTIHDPKAILNQARAKAVSDAVDQASVIARAAHVTLGPILSITEGTANVEPFMARVPAMAALEAPPPPPSPPPIAAGEETVSADVTITWAIK